MSILQKISSPLEWRWITSNARADITGSYTQPVAPILRHLDGWKPGHVVVDPVSANAVSAIVSGPNKNYRSLLYVRKLQDGNVWHSQFLQGDSKVDKGTSVACKVSPAVVLAKTAAALESLSLGCGPANVMIEAAVSAMESTWRMGPPENFAINSFEHVDYFRESRLIASTLWHFGEVRLAKDVLSTALYRLTLPLNIIKSMLPHANIVAGNEDFAIRLTQNSAMLILQMAKLHHLRGDIYMELFDESSSLDDYRYSLGLYNYIAPNQDALATTKETLAAKVGIISDQLTT